MNLNKAFLLGNLTADPEVRSLPSGQTVCSFRMATNRVWNDRQTGEKKERAEFHSVVAWGKLANVASQYLSKGSLVLIEGRLTTRSWDDSSGTKRYRTEVIAEFLQLGPKGSGASQRNTENSASGQQQPKIKKDENPPTEENIPTIEGGDDIDVEEIPY